MNFKKLFSIIHPSTHSSGWALQYYIAKLTLLSFHTIEYGFYDMTCKLHITEPVVNAYMQVKAVFCDGNAPLDCNCIVGIMATFVKTHFIKDRGVNPFDRLVLSLLVYILYFLSPILL